MTRAPFSPTRGEAAARPDGGEAGRAICPPAMAGSTSPNGTASAAWRSATATRSRCNRRRAAARPLFPRGRRAPSRRCRRDRSCSTARLSSRSAAGSTSTRCTCGSTRPRAASASWRARLRRSSMRSTAGGRRGRRSSSAPLAERRAALEAFRAERGRRAICCSRPAPGPRDRGAWLARARRRAGRRRRQAAGRALSARRAARW